MITILFRHVLVSLLQYMVASDSFPLDFRHKFGVIHHSYTPNKERDFYSMFNTIALIVSVNKLNIYWPVHLTAVTDTRRTTVIISSGTLKSGLAILPH